ncbi:conserved Plasmodium protein, unknown function [Plasmodium knowlesi strain H]|uniref:UBX domain-containing protein n=3 Tax=Plasmodium knowlesi TaxID=5850 RepID=A0A1A7VYW1_PLAKH|nr:UBX domain-containing protein, putative [Plasmodium knowlesi strain H]OTN67468.1 Uncharacterized protein PKNOH_S06435500 [Plasmodium knowlesi]CAA9987625.1 UBX domain-containing protein, putative [Plasmodium knowlesi strain H]SBO26974.1 conserved Plasmodium protein, unknown function [Plasmodium knowlesi strain H]SBO29262.1 conserved Plasmodium protein, unknown function [Plasmodium knowlesi strain H]VVS77099.1 UBX domain-containing protein, putative [Plasmodium knowlesi strain H]
MEERVKMFMEVTNLSDQEEAESILKTCEGNLEEAISTYLGQVDFERIDEDHPGNGSMRNRRNSRYGTRGTTRQPMERNEMCQRNEEKIERANLFYLLNQLGSLICPIVKSVYSLLSACLKLVSTYVVNSPENETFTTYYEEKFGKRHANFFKGSLSEAIKVSKQEEKLLLVYLHIENNDSSYFCESIFTNEDIKSFFDNCCVLFAQDITKGDIRELSNVLNVFMLPQISIIQTSNVKVYEELSIIYGTPSVSHILKSVAQCIEQMNSKKANQDRVQNKTYTDRLIREEQDREYMEAVKKDQLKVQERKKKEEEKMKKVLQKKNMKKKRREMANKFPLPIKDNEKVTKICIRLPNGMKIQDTFSLNHTLQDVYEWAECSEFLVQNPSIGKGEIIIPFKFELICGHTKAVLQRARNALGEFDLYPNAVLNMKSLDSSDEE